MNQDDDPTAEELLAAIRRNELNADLYAAYDRAWLAIRDSRNPDLRAGVRKLSVNEMRQIMRAIVPAVLQKQPIRP